jgi:hypothetical protein
MKFVGALVLALLASGAHAGPIVSKSSGPKANVFAKVLIVLQLPSVAKAIGKIKSKSPKVTFQSFLDKPGKFEKSKKFVKTVSFHKKRHYKKQVPEPAPLLLIGGGLLALGLFRRTRLRTA